MLNSIKDTRMGLLKKLNNYRLDKGWSQAKLGRVLGVSHVTVCNWFAGKTCPSDIWAYHIQKFLKQKGVKI
ncbi:MAG: XRE family transcriptional regulator [Thermoplasmata archaeon HGW-Thermoplasmata-1]|nr:MAG: XRE family transcriptional regulator [Thermoplasmata archaeon HGW-Thermoplasmata-1]